MADDTKQTQSTQGNNNSNDNDNQQTTDMVSKTDFQKVQEQVESLQKSNKTSMEELEKAKSELLSPEYLSYKEQQERDKTSPSHQNQNMDLESMSRTELVGLIKTDLTTVLEQYRVQHLDPMKKNLVQLIANEEVRQARAKYDDFDEFKDDIRKIVENNDSIGVDEAYRQARGNRDYQKTQKQKQKELEASREKPGGPSSSTTQPKEFNSKEAAAENAWEQAVGNKDSL